MGHFLGLGVFSRSTLSGQPQGGPGTCLALVILRPEGPRPFGPLEGGSDSQSKGGQPEGCWGLLHLDRILFVAGLSIFYQSAITLVTDSEAGRQERFSARFFRVHRLLNPLAPLRRKWVACEAGGRSISGSIRD